MLSIMVQLNFYNNYRTPYSKELLSLNQHTYHGSHRLIWRQNYVSLLLQIPGPLGVLRPELEVDLAWLLLMLPGPEARHQQAEPTRAHY
jgi:hypothetical protein